MNSALGRNGNAGEPTNQALADFPSTPAGVLVLHIQNKVFHLERKSVGVAERTAAPVCEPLKADSDRKSCNRSCAKCRTPCRVPPSARRLAGEQQTAASRPSPNTPSKA